MKICTTHLNFTKMVDVTRIIDREMRHLIPDTLVKYTDGSSETFKILFMETMESLKFFNEPGMVWSAVECTDFRWKDIPSVIGQLNGFLIVCSNCERYIDNGVIDLIKIGIENERVRSIVNEMTHSVLPIVEA